MIQPWWFYWYGILARLVGLQHILRGHKVDWYGRGLDEEREMGLLIWKCRGDIVCRECPDTSDGKSTLAIWCRGKDV